MKQGNHNIVKQFVDVAKSNPYLIAIVEGKREISFAKLYEEVQMTVSYFVSKGVKKGDRVLVFIPMSCDLYRIVLALFYIGAVAVFLDEWVNRKRLMLCAKLANCRAFIGTPKARFLSLFAKELRRIPIKLNWKKKSNMSIEMAKMESG